jgi:hypothetical protein
MADNARLFPTPAQVEASTPAARDRAIAVIRVVSLVGVVLGHTIMATSTLRDGVFIWSNLLTVSPVFQALTWVFQIMPLFFFAGVAATVGSWSPGISWGNWLMRRCTRLYRPVFYYLPFWAVALTTLRLVLPEHVYEPIAGISIQLLWFLGAYVLVLAAQRGGRRAAVHRRRGDAGVGRVGPEGSGTLLRGDDARGSGRRPPAGRRQGATQRLDQFEQRTWKRSAGQPVGLTALAAKLPALLCRAVGSRLFEAGVLVVGGAGRSGLLPFQRFAELAFGLVLGRGRRV